MRDVTNSEEGVGICPYDSGYHEWNVKELQTHLEKVCKKCGLMAPEPVYLDDNEG